VSRDNAGDNRRRRQPVCTSKQLRRSWGGPGGWSTPQSDWYAAVPHLLRLSSQNLIGQQTWLHYSWVSSCNAEPIRVAKEAILKLFAAKQIMLLSSNDLVLRESMGIVNQSNYGSCCLFVIFYLLMSSNDYLPCVGGHTEGSKERSCTQLFVHTPRQESRCWQPAHLRFHH
jgi:hypothetical protein